MYCNVCTLFCLVLCVLFWLHRKQIVFIYCNVCIVLSCLLAPVVFTPPRAPRVAIFPLNIHFSFPSSFFFFTFSLFKCECRDLIFLERQLFFNLIPPRFSFGPCVFSFSFFFIWSLCPFMCMLLTCFFDNKRRRTNNRAARSRQFDCAAP